MVSVVLIDTWWNVNVACLVITVGISASSFNRYMVECEYDIIRRHKWHRCHVLIDTWWNVNNGINSMGLQVQSSFNRYMVECELKTNQRIQEICKSVLIDTWWNVNEMAVKIATPGNAVLIDTWWNVNQRMPEASPQQLLGF